MRFVRSWIVGMGLAASLLLVILFLINARSFFHKTPDLNEVGPLVKGGRFDLAAALVDDYLSVFPNHARARLIAAELALDNPNPLPRIALQHLSRVASADFGLVAVAQLNEGKAEYVLGLYGRAEKSWLRALELDPKVPEAAWALLDLYYIEGRADEARRLAVRQHEKEPDPHDRVQLLLELVRQDAEPPEPSTVIERLTPIVRQSFRETRAAIALGLARVHNSMPDLGLNTLRGIMERWPDDPDARDALLTGLDDAGHCDELSEALAHVPPALAEHPRLFRHRGRAAQERGDWPLAIAFYQRARKSRPDDFVSSYRLGLLLHAKGEHDEAKTVDQWTRNAEAAREAVLDLYREANAIKDLGTAPHIVMYRRLAENRERLGRRAEARAWTKLILEIRPGDPASLAALVRLK